MKTQKLPNTDLVVVTDCATFLSQARTAAGEGDGLRVTALEGGPRPSSLDACLSILDSYPASILLIDAGANPEDALQLTEEIFEQRTAPRVFVAGPVTDPQLILRAQRAGASEFLPLPLEDRMFRDALQRFRKRHAVAMDHPGQQRGRILPFLGAKGGCGTTTVATNLAVTLARQGHSTILVDLDRSGSDVALLLNLNPSFGIVDVAQNAHRLDRDLLKGMVVRHPSGLEVLTGSESPEQAAGIDPDTIARTLGFLRDQFDCVVVNTGDLSDPLTQVAVNEAEVVHVITCLDLLYLRRAQWFLRRLAQSGLSRDQVRLVINRHEKNPYISHDEAEKALDLKVVWTIPADRRSVLDALNDGTPFVIRSRNGLCASFNTYARQLAPARKIRRGAHAARRLFGFLSPRGAKQTREGNAPA